MQVSAKAPTQPRLRRATGHVPNAIVEVVEMRFGVAQHAGVGAQMLGLYSRIIAIREDIQRAK